VANLGRVSLSMSNSTRAGLHQSGVRVGSGMHRGADRSTSQGGRPHSTQSHAGNFVFEELFAATTGQAFQHGESCVEVCLERHGFERFLFFRP
jgi:hypothetical protein